MTLLSSAPSEKFHLKQSSSETLNSQAKGLKAQSIDDMPNEFNYHLLRYALKDFTQNISQLNAVEYKKIYQKALASYALESQVIATPEAEHQNISMAQVEGAVKTLASRYEDEREFIQDLNNNFLDLTTLRIALRRELLFDRVMQHIASQSPEVKPVDIELFYEMHRNRFETPEKREASHILITINPDFLDNTRTAAFTKITHIANCLSHNSKQFSELAKRYSECPTAMEEGKLGDIVRGQLYPQLDTELFKMSPNTLSSVVESEIGFHILFCHKIYPRKKIPLSQVTEKIKQTLHSRYLHSTQKAWLEQLKSQTT